MFDAQCDFAAVAYGTDDDPDRLLLGFAADLRRVGLRPAGIVQLRPHQRDDDRLDAVILSNQQAVSLGHDRACGHHQCQLDPGGIADITYAITAAIRDGADVVIINRFGKLEAEGRGLIDLIEEAVAADIPVLIAVPEHRFAAWIKYCSGMSVRLPCRRAALDQWWQSVAGHSIERTDAGRFCELVK
jgi:hypothetical protein